MRDLGSGVRKLDSSRVAGAYLVQAAERLVLVDCGTRRAGRKIADELERDGSRPELIVLTHGDPDHAGGADAVRERFEIEVWAPEADRENVEQRLANRGVAPRIVGTLTRHRPPHIDHWFGPDEPIAGLEPIPTPGHTPGHTSFRCGQALIAGDAVVTGEDFKVPPGLLNVDTAEARESIAKLAGLAVELAVSGHGKPARNAQYKLRRLVESWL
jgi:glyoxylase-like metal-dependent hydrolase (beta-lactamase superfamily II)